MVFLLTEESNEMYVLSFRYVPLDVTCNAGCDCTFTVFINNNQRLFYTIYSVLKRSNLI